MSLNSVTLVKDVRSKLRGFTRSHEQQTWLTLALDSASTTVSVNDGSKVLPGMVEIENELVDVASVNGNTLTLFPDGRGFDGSSALAHLANARVTNRPLFPYVSTIKALADTVADASVDLSGTTTVAITTNVYQGQYELPSDVNTILMVSWQATGSTGLWVPVKRWNLITDAYGSTGKAIQLGDPMDPGVVVRVTYTIDPVVTPTTGIDFTVTGWPDTMSDVLVYGTAARLLSAIDSSLLDPNTVQSQFSEQRRAVGSASGVSKQLWAVYQSRLAREVDRFRQQTQVSIQYTR